MNANKYKKPFLRAIKLCKEQALLSVCQIGGGYFGSFTKTLCVIFHETATNSCSWTPKATTAGPGTVGTVTTNACPS